MKRDVSKWMLCLLTACQAGRALPDDHAGALIEGCAEVPAEKTQVIVDGDISADTTWTKDKVYRLGGVIAVENATLTVEAGTTVQGTLRQRSALIITPSARLVTQGSKAEPVVFTSCKKEGEREAGDWGGIALLGKASVNTVTGTGPIEGLPEDPRFVYGGGATPNDAHDCGSVKYTRVEFAGQAFQPDKELNSFTFAGCGSGTSVDYIQAHLGKDDLLEFFGGSVNVKHAVLTHGDDDGLDWQLGYTGRVQFVVFQQFVSAQAERGVEADNNELNLTAAPFSAPIVANATFIGAGKDTPTSSTLKQNGAVLRRGTRGHIVDAVFTEFRSAALVVSDKQTVKVDGVETQITDPARDNWSDGSLKVDHVLLYRNGALGEFEAGAMSADVSNMLEIDGMLEAPLDLDAPNAKPLPGSPLLDPARALDPATLDAFFDPAPFVGAVGADDWTLGWTSYPRN